MSESPRERDDPVQARLDATLHAQEKGAAPHWIRCTWYLDHRRCLLAGDHKGKEHVYPSGHFTPLAP